VVWEWSDHRACASRRAKSGVYLRVLKNTLARRAVAGTPFEGLAGSSSSVRSSTALLERIRSAAAKVLNDFAKSNDKLVLQGRSHAEFRHGCTLRREGTGVDAEPRRVAVRSCLGTMQAPVATFVRTLNEVPGQIRPYSRSARRTQKAGSRCCRRPA
jgi:large subunit ribosomal protein L10